MNFYVKRYGEFSRRARRPGEPNAKLHWLWSTLIALYFIAGFVILFTRWFVTTQLDDHLAAIESAVTDASVSLSMPSTSRGAFTSFDRRSF